MVVRVVSALFPLVHWSKLGGEGGVTKCLVQIQLSIVSREGIASLNKIGLQLTIKHFRLWHQPSIIRKTENYDMICEPIFLAAKTQLNKLQCCFVLNGHL